MKNALVISIIFLSFLAFTALASAEWVQNQRIDLLPINEGYILYNSGTTTYTKNTPWIDAITQLNAKNIDANNNERIFLEFNLSHYLPVDANITMMNLTYTSGNTPVVGAGVVGFIWVAINNSDGNTTNQSSGEYLWRSIQTGPAMVDSTFVNDWASSTPECIFNRSTYGPGITVNSEGYWIMDGTIDAKLRNIRNMTMANLSSGRDQFIIGSYVPTGADAGVAVMNSSISTLNTSLWGVQYPGPALICNVTYNRSQINASSSFINNSILSYPATATFDIYNSNGTDISYYINVYNVSNGTWWEELFVRRASSATISAYLYNATYPGCEYYWYAGVVGNTTIPVIYHFFVATRNIIVSLRYENISTETSSNELINITSVSLYSSHRFTVHYSNASSISYFFNWQTYANNGYTPNLTIGLIEDPLFYQLDWNYSINSTALNWSCQYTRLLTPLAETTESGNTILTFYMTTNSYLYNQYYLFTPYGGTSYYNLSDDINSLVDYSYQLEDLSGYFNPSNSYNTIASIFTHVGTSKVIIDQRYVDAAAKINPTLNYHSYYYIGLNSTVTTSINDYYQNLGLIPTERVTSPYVETITIYSLSSDNLELLSNITYSTQWMSTGFYFNYTDTSSSTTYLTITIFNVTNNTFQYLSTQWANGTSDYDFQYITTNPWHDNISYRVYLNFTYTFDNGISKTFTLPGGTLIFKPSGYNIVTNTTINGIFTLIFGPSPFYHPDNNYFVQYADIIIMFIGIFLLLSFTGTGNAVLGIGSQGIFYLLMTFIISGISTYFAVLGVFLLIIAVLYAIRNSGGPKE